MSERLKETVLKTVVAKSHREFESRPLRRNNFQNIRAMRIFVFLFLGLPKNLPENGLRQKRPQGAGGQRQQ